MNYLLFIEGMEFVDFNYDWMDRLLEPVVEGKDEIPLNTRFNIYDYPSM